MQHDGEATPPSPARYTSMRISIRRLLTAALATALPVVAQAQTEPPAVKPAAPGILVPQTDPDPGIAAKPPSPPQAFPMPVIRPPGAAGNPSPVQPK